MREVTLSRVLVLMAVITFALDACGVHYGRLDAVEMAALGLGFYAASALV